MKDNLTYEEFVEEYKKGLPTDLNMKQVELVKERTKLIMRSLIEPTKELMDKIKELDGLLGIE